jgi:Flp pilus assembly protein TadD
MYPTGHSRSEGERLAATNRNNTFSEIVLQVCLHRAAELARSGRFQEAETALSEITPPDEQRPAVLDLLARIRAQQGRLREAEALWTRANALQPENEAYRAALQRQSMLQRRPLWLR